MADLFRNQTADRTPSFYQLQRHPQAAATTTTTSKGGCGGLFTGAGMGAGNNTNRHRVINDFDLAKEMNELSVKERERVLDDIHGVAKVHDETPEEVKANIIAFEDAISMIPKSKRKAYDRAVFLRPSLQIHADAFKLMFLRADLYDPHKAANRMVKFFEWKQDLFGEDLVAKDLTMNDLNEKDRANLNYVGGVVLPKRDPSGRPTVFFDMSKFDYEHPITMLRCFWYQVMSLLEDETVQMKGVCVVSYCPGNLLALPSSISNVSNLIFRGGEMVSSLPIKVAGDHFCYDDVRVQYIISAIRLAFGKPIRLRIRTHFGSNVEIQYSLMTFGLLCQDLLLDVDGYGNDTKRRTLQEQYIQERMEKEQLLAQRRAQEELDTGIILYPGMTDVLVGRGRPYQDYCGNRAFGQFVDSYLDQYRACNDRFQKTCIFMQVVKRVQEESKGRFIERNKSSSSSPTVPAGWVIVDDTVAREKTASGFRFKIKTSLENNNNNINAVLPSSSSSPLESDRTKKRLKYDPSRVKNFL